MKRLALLGVAGWERPAWSEAFYPSDMPQEWRLSYYNTQFSCVFLAASVWRLADMATLAAWAEDTHEHFLFLLEQAFPEALPACLADRALGIGREDPSLLWVDRQTSLKTLAGHLAAGDTRLFLVSRDGDLGQIERVRTLIELMGL